MKLVDANNDILALIKEQIGQEQFDNNFDLSSPDSDVEAWRMCKVKVELVG